MSTFYIYGIKKDDGYHSDPDAAIDKYFYIDSADNQHYGADRQYVVDKVKTGMVDAYTFRDGRVGAKCVCMVSPQGVEYLKTIPNGNPADNLSSLPECE